MNELMSNHNGSILSTTRMLPYLITVHSHTVIKTLIMHFFTYSLFPS